MIMNVNLEFRRAAQVLPKKSGRYVCITGKGRTLQVLQYSARFNLFNQFDWQDQPDDQAIKVSWWAPLPAGLQNLH